MPAREPLLVLGIGNETRSDDGAGAEVVRILARRARPDAVRALLVDGDPIRLIAEWSGHDRVVVVDAARSGAPPGTVHRIDGAGPLPAWLGNATSSHAVGLAETLALARAIGRMPGELLVVAIEGRTFEPGTGLTPAVRRACESVADQLRLGDG
jgi:hydrogenase maturation protease